MVKDFTRIGKVSPVTKEDAPVISPQANARNQQIVVAAIGFAALAFFLAGVWLVSGMPSFFPPDISRYLGIGFIVASMADLFAIKFIKRAWAMKQGG